MDLDGAARMRRDLERRRRLRVCRRLRDAANRHRRAHSSSILATLHVCTDACVPLARPAAAAPRRCSAVPVRDGPQVVPQAKAVDPTHLKYREQWMAPSNTAELSADQVRDRIHEVVANLDSSFDVPSTAEGLEMLTHVRSHDEVDQLATWLGAAHQQAPGQGTGWATPPPTRLLAAAAGAPSATVRRPRPKCMLE